MLKGRASIELLEELEALTKQFLDFFNARILPLTQQQLEWSSDTGAWSCADVIHHLNAHASHYHPVFLEKIRQTDYRQPVDVFLSSPLGSSAWKSMKLGNVGNIRRKFKAPKSFNPSKNSSLIHEGYIEKFQSNQETLLQILEEARGINLRRVKIPLSLSRFIKLRLGDALIFITYHNRRHQQQLLNILSNSQFPIL
jgi:hypothetical protein